MLTLTLEAHLMETNLQIDSNTNLILYKPLASYTTSLSLVLSCYWKMVHWLMEIFQVY